ncbi:trimethylguanosine synthase [Rhodotorula toruloides]|uniref:Trimethylguanosine synthase n=1 Tax=Rhodotorula toruloides TaxID=5286 RepID=A0A511KN88_RHOTO|nr:trimethylguanosine synthase [Rhodotorula toruloides]
MRHGQRQNAILNSPIVRSFIRPVRAILPTSTKTASGGTAVDQDRTIGDAGAPVINGAEEEEGEWLIPTQPVSGSSAYVKGKKRAREEDDADGEPAKRVVEYDAAAGTRFGEVVRYTNDNLPDELEKYWAQRYRLFSLFDEGCEMDREGWYSVTPENIAAQIAERCRCGVIVDAFCGVGGNAIQFAFTCERVIALDVSPVRLACAAHNARIYGVADRITFVLADWVKWTKDYVERLRKGEVKDEEKIEVVFLSPPWGGVDYLSAGNSTDSAALMNGAKTPPSRCAKKPRRSLLPTRDSIPSTPTPVLPSASDSSSRPLYPLSALVPLPGSELFTLARQCTRNIAFYLPRNVDLFELATLPGLKEGEKVEIEEDWMGYKLKAVTAYYGELAVGNGWVQGRDGEANPED